MTMEAISHGQPGSSGMPANGTIGSATRPAPIAINTVVASGSRVRLMLAFQPAWHAAANSTAMKTNGSIRARRASCSWALGSAALGELAVVVQHRLQQHLR